MVTLKDDIKEKIDCNEREHDNLISKYNVANKIENSNIGAFAYEDETGYILACFDWSRGINNTINGELLYLYLQDKFDVYKKEYNHVYYWAVDSETLWIYLKEFQFLYKNYKTILEQIGYILNTVNPMIEKAFGGKQ